jgi:Fe-S cluster assembly protein SufD
MSTSAIDTGLLERAVRNLPGDSLTALRKEAAARFAETGFPTTRHEDWRYTNLAPAIELSNLWLRESAPVVADARPSGVARNLAADIAGRIEAHWIVVANGVVDNESLSRLEDQALPGFRAVSVAGDSAPRPATGDEAMTRFNTALLRDLLHITIGADCNLDKPVGLLLIDHADGAATLSQARAIVDVAPNARAEFIEYHTSTGDHSNFANVVIELHLATGSAVDYVRIQDRDEAHYQVGRMMADMGRDTTLRHSAFDFGGALVRNDLSIDLAHPGANVELYGLYLASGTQHIDNHTRVDHRVGPATSNEEYRGILSDRARCVFNGKAIVHEGADGTDARQANHNLLLSAKAEVDTKPELEIYADDVKCSHGATVGQLDKNALFYLRSRGLDREYAAKVLTRAFAAAIVARSPVRNAQSHIEALIDERLQVIVGEPA